MIEMYPNETRRLKRFKKDELIEFIVLMNMAMETRPFFISYPSEKSKKRYTIFIDERSNRLQRLRILARFIIRFWKEALN
jgi:hypothetical protein